jgi:hypothetical protein
VRLGEVEGPLDARVEHHAVEVGVGVEDRGRERGDGRELRDVHRHGRYLVAGTLGGRVLGYEGVEAILSSAGDDDGRPVREELGGQRLAYARGGSDDEGLLVEGRRGVGVSGGEFERWVWHVRVNFLREPGRPLMLFIYFRALEQ